MAHTIHELKTHPGSFERVASGSKTAEIRKMDRPFRVGDVLTLREYDPVLDAYSGREIEAEITDIFTGEGYGLDHGYGLLSISLLPQGLQRRIFNPEDDDLWECKRRSDEGEIAMLRWVLNDNTVLHLSQNGEGELVLTPVMEAALQLAREEAERILDSCSVVIVRKAHSSQEVQ